MFVYLHTERMNTSPFFKLTMWRDCFSVFFSLLCLHRPLKSFAPKIFFFYLSFQLWIARRSRETEKKRIVRQSREKKITRFIISIISRTLTAYGNLIERHNTTALFWLHFFFSSNVFIFFLFISTRTSVNCTTFSVGIFLECELFLDCSVNKIKTTFACA